MENWFHHELSLIDSDIKDIRRILGDKVESKYSNVRARLDNIEKNIDIYVNSRSYYNIATIEDWKAGIFNKTALKNSSLMLAYLEPRWSYFYEGDVNLTDKKWVLESTSTTSGSTVYYGDTLYMGKDAGTGTYSYILHDDLINDNKGFSVKIGCQIGLGTKFNYTARTGAYKLDAVFADSYVSVNGVSRQLDMKNIREIQFRCDLGKGIADLWIDGIVALEGILLTEDYTTYPNMRIGSFVSNDKLAVTIDKIHYAYEYISSTSGGYVSNGTWTSPIVYLGENATFIDNLELQGIFPSYVDNLNKKGTVLASTTRSGYGSDLTMDGTITKGWMSSNTELPSNAWIVYDLQEKKTITNLRVFNGISGLGGTTTGIGVYASDDGVNFRYITDFKTTSTLQWVEWIGTITARYIRLQNFKSTDGYVRLGEVEILGVTQFKPKMWISLGDSESSMSGFSLLPESYQVGRQNKYVQLKAELSTTNQKETPYVDVISIKYKLLTHEEKLSKMEYYNSIHLAKMNFKVNSIVKSSAYKIVNMYIDDFVDNSKIELLDNVAIQNDVILIPTYQPELITNGDWSARSGSPAKPDFWTLTYPADVTFGNSLDYLTFSATSSTVESKIQITSPVFYLTEKIAVKGGWLYDNGTACSWTVTLYDSATNTLMETFTFQNEGEWLIDTSLLARTDVYAVFETFVNQNVPKSRVYIKETSKHYPVNKGTVVLKPIEVPAETSNLIFISEDSGFIDYEYSFDNSTWNPLNKDLELPIVSGTTHVYIRANIYEHGKWLAKATAFF